MSLPSTAQEHRHMAGPGRPILYKPANGELARKFCLLGATHEDLAGLFDVAVPTVDNCIATIPDFPAAVTQGRDVAVAPGVQSLHPRATAYSNETEKIFHYRGKVRKVLHPVRCPPDTAACMFGRRNRRPQHWLEKAESREEEEFDFARALDAAGEAMRPAAGDARRAEEE